MGGHHTDGKDVCRREFGAVESLLFVGLGIGAESSGDAPCEVTLQREMSSEPEQDRELFVSVRGFDHRARVTPTIKGIQGWLLHTT